jgi:deazaflavin-dependent oxidoreductase (nitroreductase family)
VEDDLVAWGRVLRLETRGRVTGSPVRVAVGFVEAPDGSLLVAAGDPGADWARNLLEEPAARVTIGERSFAVRARELTGAEAASAVRDLILRYGTPSERLGGGPVFALEPLPAA